MLLTGKKLLLTSLVLISTTKLVNACEYVPGFKDQIVNQLAERDSNVKLYFFAAVFLIAANIAVFFVRQKHDYLIPFAVILTAFISAPFLFLAILNDSCGNTIVKDLRINFYIFLGFLIFQICLWLKRTDVRFNKGKTTLSKQ
jgi:hypothetical protein